MPIHPKVVNAIHPAYSCVCMSCEYIYIYICIYTWVRLLGLHMYVIITQTHIANTWTVLASFYALWHTLSHFIYIYIYIYIYIWYIANTWTVVVRFLCAMAYSLFLSLSICMYVYIYIFSSSLCLSPYMYFWS
jgi:hypothetical protein